MKRLFAIIVMLVLAVSISTGCGSKEESNAGNEQTVQNEEAEKDKGEQVKEEDSEKDSKEEKIEKLSQKQLKERFNEYEGELYEIQKKYFKGGFYTADPKESEFYKDIPEFRKYVDKVLGMGYGISQGEGMYYLYMGEEPQYTDGEVEEPSAEKGEDKTFSGLIYTNDKNYWEYKPDSTVYSDLDGDGKDEEILFDSSTGKLLVNGYFREAGNMQSTDYSSFAIIAFNDKFGADIGKIIGIKDFGPSMDYTTTFYVYWTEVNGQKSKNPIISVGTTGGLISRSDTFDRSNSEDFNTKAILTDEGIEAPVRLEKIHTWWGRNIFTYYGTYKSLINNIHKYDQDYDTSLGNNVLYQKESSTYYSEKDENSPSVISSGGQNIRMTKTDDNEWVYMVADDGTQGWARIETVKSSGYDGFQFYD
ncbi:hypothetical protein SAMN02745945_01475 [Peptoclostridium litorale DSM 5388]|uniref:SH3b domain-containing protein n=1 Tax=Peptoclostridium litorale DSM 5388 TaxID=1121324 RepID=A0A069RF29_PEPLI|nr:hypothetical protein [Peptoclostridium litorale]KDR95624.1 hypothetical protein CLIT_10c03510 [Peptoclostridium litorale DSM 5388]SIN99672.1 hypothetical protein SAMN02745945_01475 [Peptoclostridium litorale DSM 5388]